MQKPRFTDRYRFFVSACLLFSIVIIAGGAFAVDILEIRVKRLYKEAQLMTSQGDYDGALQAYNKAISWAKDKDIKQFLINARKELQKNRLKERGETGTLPLDEKTEKPVAEKIIGGLTAEEAKAKQELSPEAKQKIAEEKAKLEEEKADLEAERRKFTEEKAKLEEEKRKREAEQQAKLDEEKRVKEAREKAKLEEEKAKLEAEKRRLEAERAKLEEEKQQAETAKKKPAPEEEKRRAEEADRVRRIEEFKSQKAKKEAMSAEKEVKEEVRIEKEKPQEEDKEELADLEKRKEREAEDRAVYEGTNYRYQIKDILNDARNKFKEAASKIEEEGSRKRIEAKINNLTALDQEAEKFISQGAYEKARDTYEKILDMSKDPDLKEYLERQK